MSEDTHEAPRWPRTLVAAGVACAVLLVGAMLGFFLAQTLPGHGSDTTAPNTVDVGFAQDMSVHHLQAVTMANWARDHSVNPEIQQLAFDIASTQTEQVGRMKGWLMLWGKPEQAVGPYMSWMQESSGHGGHGQSGSGTAHTDAAMPGMATDDELSRMRSLSGDALDVEFLKLMLRHHQGGVGMAQYAQEHASSSAVKQLTDSILVSQGAEVNLMTQMLTTRGAQPLPAP